MSHVIVKKEKIVPTIKVKSGKNSTDYESIEDSASLIQSYHNGLEISVLSKEGKQCYPFAFCKDYLQDVIWATVNKKKSEIYGLSFDPKKDPTPDTEVLRIALRDKDESASDLYKKCKKAVSFINKLETVMKHTPSKLYTTKAHGVFVIIADKGWMYSTVLLSLYVRLLRLGLSYEGGDAFVHCKEAKVLRSVDRIDEESMKSLKTLIENRKEDLFADSFEKNYPADVDIHAMHSGSGFYYYSKNCINKNVAKNWKDKSHTQKEK